MNEIVLSTRGIWTRYFPYHAYLKLILSIANDVVNQFLMFFAFEICMDHKTSICLIGKWNYSASYQENIHVAHSGEFNKFASIQSPSSSMVTLEYDNSGHLELSLCSLLQKTWISNNYDLMWWYHLQQIFHNRGYIL
jgi:hypothetical protein